MHRKVAAGFVTIALLAGACGQTTGPDAGSTTNLVVSVFHPEPAAYTLLVEALQEDVEARTAGGVQLDLFFDGTLATLDESLDAVRRGTVDITMLAASILSADLPELAYAEIMGAYPADIVAEFEPLYQATTGAFETVLAGEDVVLLAWGPVSTEVLFYSRNHLLRAPADFQGQSLRSAGRWQGEQIAALGAVPVGMDPAELYVALQTGTVDGAPQVGALALAQRLHEVAPYVTHLPLSANTIFYVMNGSVWNDLSETEQRAFTAAGQDLSLRMPGMIAEVERAAVDTISQEDGVTFERLDDSERAALLQAMAGVRTELAALVAAASPAGAELVSAFDAATQS